MIDGAAPRSKWHHRPTAMLEGFPMTPPSDETLVRSAVRAAVPHSRGWKPRWMAVMDVLTVGSNTAWMLCTRFGFDPEERVRRR